MNFRLNLQKQKNEIQIKKEKKLKHKIKSKLLMLQRHTLDFGSQLVKTLMFVRTCPLERLF